MKEKSSSLKKKEISSRLCQEQSLHYVDFWTCFRLVGSVVKGKK